jgi:hypothetical protein
VFQPAVFKRCANLLKISQYFISINWHRYCIVIRPTILFAGGMPHYLAQENIFPGCIETKNDNCGKGFILNTENRSSYGVF